MGYSVDRHDKNFTAFKVYVRNDDDIESIFDRFRESAHSKFRRDRKAMLESVHAWCSNIDALYNSGYKVRFDQKCGCSCGCSPGFRVIVNGLKVRNSGYTQLLKNEGSRCNDVVWLDMKGNSTKVIRG
tara:strand:- start:371 stop:754 length:384 start_codon:yes stop_codon:yes gene_type:complete